MKFETIKQDKPDSKDVSKHSFPLEQIYFYLTAGCNLACRHCWLNPGYQDRDDAFPTLPFEQFRSIISQAMKLGLRAVKLTGGEPLMHPHIHEILEIIKQKDLDLTVETNGLLCTPQLSQQIAQCKNPGVSVSLDGVDARTHEAIRGIKGSFDAAIKGIKNIVNAGIAPQIIMSVMQSNKRQIVEMVQLAETLGAASIKFNLVNPAGRAEKLAEKGDTIPVEELLQIGNWVTDVLAAKTNLELNFSFPMAFRKLSDIYGGNGTCCGLCNIRHLIGVLADGSYALCGIGTHVPDLVFGNSATDPLEDVWTNHKVIKELREDIASRFEGICSRCHMKRECLASCIAQNYYRSGNLFTSFWFCEEAYRKGLFPATRMVPERK